MGLLVLNYLIQLEKNPLKTMKKEETQKLPEEESKTPEESKVPDGGEGTPKDEEADNEYLKPNWDESVDRFDDMGLKEETLRGIYGYGFNKPSPIQCKGILPVIQGHDTIA